MDWMEIIDWLVGMIVGVNWTEVATVPVITAITLGACWVYKKVVTSEKWIRLIPIWAVLLGVILGIVAYFAVPSLMPAEDVLTAILLGGASGGLATCLHQVVKQQSKNKSADDSNFATATAPANTSAESDGDDK